MVLSTVEMFIQGPRNWRRRPGLLQLAVPAEKIREGLGLRIMSSVWPGNQDMAWGASGCHAVGKRGMVAWWLLLVDEIWRSFSNGVHHPWVTGLSHAKKGWNREQSNEGGRWKAKYVRNPQKPLTAVHVGLASIIRLPAAPPTIRTV